MRYNWSISEFPGNNGWDVSISSKIQPIAHISTGLPYSVSPTNNSGERYHLVATYSVYFAPGPPFIFILFHFIFILFYFILFYFVIFFLYNINKYNNDNAFTLIIENNILRDYHKFYRYYDIKWL